MGTGLGARKRTELPLTVRAWRVKKREYSVKIILSLCLACLCTLSAYAQQQPVTQVHTALNHLTVIEVGEPITMAAAGSDAFEIERHANRVFVKPTRAGVSTNLFVWTEHGRSVYELQPAADVSKMDVLIGAAQTPSVSATADTALGRRCIENCRTSLESHLAQRRASECSWPQDAEEPGQRETGGGGAW